MADEADIAGEYEAAQIAASLARHAAKPRPAPREDCEDCGDTIPPARVALGVATCIACQRDREVRERKAKGR